MLSMEIVCKDSDLTRKKNMTDLPTLLPKTSKPIGVAADHGGYELKEYLVGMLRRGRS